MNKQEVAILIIKITVAIEIIAVIMKEPSLINYMIPIQIIALALHSEKDKHRIKMTNEPELEALLKDKLSDVDRDEVLKYTLKTTSNALNQLDRNRKIDLIYLLILLAISLTVNVVMFLIN